MFNCASSRKCSRRSTEKCWNVAGFLRKMSLREVRHLLCSRKNSAVLTSGSSARAGSSTERSSAHSLGRCASSVTPCAVLNTKKEGDRLPFFRPNVSGNATDAFLSPRVGRSVISLASGAINALLFIIGAFDNAPIGVRTPVRASLARRGRGWKFLN